MEEDTFNNISLAVKSTIKESKGDFSFLNNINPSEIVEQFKFDKKGDGESVPLILINNPGDMIFYRYYFSSNTTEIIDSISYSINKFIQWGK